MSRVRTTVKLAVEHPDDFTSGDLADAVAAYVSDWDGFQVERSTYTFVTLKDETEKTCRGCGQPATRSVAGERLCEQHFAEFEAFVAEKDGPRC